MRFKDIAIYALLVYYGNVFFPYISGTIAINKPFKAFNTQGVYMQAPELEREAGMLEFLNASSLALSKAERKGEADCDDYTRGVYEIFTDLTEHHDRPDLSSRLRIVAGVTSSEDRKIGHVWLQYRSGGSWKDYDPIVGAMSLDDRLATRDVEHDYLVLSTIAGTRFPLPPPEIELFDPTKRGELRFQIDMMGYYKEHSFLGMLAEEWLGR